MDKIYEQLIKKLDISTPKTFITVYLGFVIVTCLLADFISTTSFSYFTPGLMEQFGYEVHVQTFVTTFIISGLFFLIFLSQLKRIDHLRRVLSHRIKHDDLTGLLTREAFLENVVRDNIEIKDALLIIDADFFKNINDQHGHLVGDRALIHITQALKKDIRKSDSIGRIGGEEFAVHLKNVTSQRALEISERLRENVREANATFDVEGVDLSVSIGTVVYEETIALPALMNKADRLLYKAKEKGRNRVEHTQLSSAEFA